MFTREQKDKLNYLMYEVKDDRERIRLIKAIDSAEKLYYYTLNYNCDDGFVIPNIIADHPYCDLTIALTLFWVAGAEKLYAKEEQSKEMNKEWFNFAKKITDRILEGHYEIGINKFDPQFPEHVT